jgi:hypothetical protein
LHRHSLRKIYCAAAQQGLTTFSPRGGVLRSTWKRCRQPTASGAVSVRVRRTGVGGARPACGQRLHAVPLVPRTRSAWLIPDHLAASAVVRPLPAAASMPQKTSPRYGARWTRLGGGDRPTSVAPTGAGAETRP